QLLNVWKLPYQKEKIAQTSARTHFEIKYLERGELCQQLIMTKPEGYNTRFDEFAPLQGQIHVE
ncbi:SAM-dependent methyltransferase, partial [Acinetobacter baumannii]